MSAALDNRQQAQLNLQNFSLDHTMRYAAHTPTFTNPWNAASSSSIPTSSPAQLYASDQGSPTGMDAYAHQAQRTGPTTLNLPFPQLPTTTASVPSSEYKVDYRTYPNYTTAVPASSGYVTAPAPAYQFDYNRPASLDAYNQYAPHDRRQSNPMLMQSRPMGEAIEASRTMIGLSNADITPRNIYGDRGSSRSSSNSYGFPSTHSAHSSISSASSGYPTAYNYPASIADSVASSEYSSADSVDLDSRTLPRPSTLLPGGFNSGVNPQPAPPSSMMGQFSSRIQSSAQKKHVCKICDKRFTRPSSLQTHVYSHTGEKPFACELPGCGRCFSVVSNLRRHQKTHVKNGETQRASSIEEED